MKMSRIFLCKSYLEAGAALSGMGNLVLDGGGSKSRTLITQYLQMARRSLSTQIGKVEQQSSDQLPPIDPDVMHADMLQRLTKLYEDEARRNLVVPPFKKALLYGEKSAIRDHTGDYSFIQLYEAVKRLAIQIANCCGSASQSRVAFICPNNATYVISQWACWFSGQVAVPLNPNYPKELLEYYIKDCDASLLIATPEFQKIAQPLATKLDKKLLLVHHDLLNNGTKADEEISYLDPKREHLVQLQNTLVVEGCLNGEFYRDSNALILYTSGTTGKPKGVVLSFANIDAQFNSLAHAWQFTSTDSVLHTLPLNHVHGTINALNLPLSQGAKCVMLPKFDSSNVWSYLLNVNMTTKERVNIFMGVPTMYGLLIKEYDNVFAKNARMCDYVKTHCKNKIKLMISGSAPLPGTIFQRWQEITSHNLLERYGMTEIGMAISNPFIQDETRVRKQGCVGLPLPGVALKIVDNETNKQLILEGKPSEGFWNTTPSTKPTEETEPITGHLYVKGKSVFKEYWQKPTETASEFEDGWFKTGDSVEFSDGTIKMLGRTSVDVIKSGGFKLSALEIETALHEHPEVSDVAVMGIPDETWGSKVVAVLSVKNAESFSIPHLLVWLESKLPKQAIPKEVKLVTEIPRNAMGKINKKELQTKLYDGSNQQSQEKVVK